MNIPRLHKTLILITLTLLGCSTTPTVEQPNEPSSWSPYRIGGGDIVDIFVWRNPDVSVQAVPIRPDGRLTIPLVENIDAVGKTPEELARLIEEKLQVYIKEPRVTVTVKQFVGDYAQQVRIVGEAAQPTSLPYREGMTVLDVVISVGGLTEFAAGNKAMIIRDSDTKIPVFLDDILIKGDFTTNHTLAPGDVLLIPLAWF
ncbi:MAG: sugar ABC transporter substrate-binding protein [Gammaproteobacteria bacterium]|nr:MAG: sugar ABC transporter substrate-binding protein [Gammaproteobacteria bacterium]RLA20363.1 MAG: sugar ABC transporter substrate-binding protein [Gammaproteobacteria bacterium]